MLPNLEQSLAALSQRFLIASSHLFQFWPPLAKNTPSLFEQVGKGYFYKAIQNSLQVVYERKEKYKYPIITNWKMLTFVNKTLN